MDVDLFDLQNENKKYNKNECRNHFNKLIECFVNVDKGSTEHTCLKDITLYAQCNKIKVKKT